MLILKSNKIKFKSHEGFQELRFELSQRLYIKDGQKHRAVANQQTIGLFTSVVKLQANHFSSVS